MGTVFPGAIDNLSNPTTATDQNVAGALNHASQHADANDALEALEAKVGVDSSAVTSSLDYKVTQLLANAIQTIVEADGSPSLQRKILKVGGLLTDVDANNALLEWTLLLLKDSDIASYVGKAGWAIQINATEDGFDASAPWDIASLSGNQLLIALDAPNSRVTFTVNPPAPTNIAMIGSPLTSAVAITSTTVEWPNNQRRRKIDLTNATQARMSAFIGSTAFSAGTLLGVQYSLDQSTWIYLDAATGPTVAVDTINTVQAGSWVTIAPLARADVYLRLVGRGGNGAVISAIVGAVDLQVK